MSPSLYQAIARRSAGRHVVDVLVAGWSRFVKEAREGVLEFSDSDLP
jgi:hypothetical protein